jgi:hypothetical protein
LFGLFEIQVEDLHDLAGYRMPSSPGAQDPPLPR